MVRRSGIFCGTILVCQPRTSPQRGITDHQWSRKGTANCLCVLMISSHAAYSSHSSCDNFSHEPDSLVFETQLRMGGLHHRYEWKKAVWRNKSLWDHQTIFADLCPKTVSIKEFALKSSVLKPDSGELYSITAQSMMYYDILATC